MQYKKTFTHTGILIGCDARIPNDYRRCIFLRETKNFWVSRNGCRYRKSDLRPPGCDSPMDKIEKETINKLNVPVIS